MVFGNCLMVPDDLADDEVEEFLRKGRVKVGVLGEAAKPGNLCGLPPGIPRGQPVGSFEEPNLLGGFEALGQKVNQGGINVVDAGADGEQFSHHGRVHLAGQRTGGGVVVFGIRTVKVVLRHASSLWAGTGITRVLSAGAANRHRRSRLHGTPGDNRLDAEQRPVFFPPPRLFLRIRYGQGRDEPPGVIMFRAAHYLVADTLLHQPALVQDPHPG